MGLMVGQYGALSGSNEVQIPVATVPVSS